MQIVTHTSNTSFTTDNVHVEGLQGQTSPHHRPWTDARTANVIDGISANIKHSDDDDDDDDASSV